MTTPWRTQGPSTKETSDYKNRKRSKRKERGNRSRKARLKAAKRKFHQSLIFQSQPSKEMSPLRKRGESRVKSASIRSQTWKYFIKCTGNATQEAKSKESRRELTDLRARKSPRAKILKKRLRFQLLKRSRNCSKSVRRS